LAEFFQAVAWGYVLSAYPPHIYVMVRDIEENLCLPTGRGELLTRGVSLGAKVAAGKTLDDYILLL